MVKPDGKPRSNLGSYLPPQNMKMQSFVMPAWMAGIHLFGKDASGNIHVAWIPALHAGMTNRRVLIEPTGPLGSCLQRSNPLPQVKRIAAGLVQRLTVTGIFC
jgi:hypothetical protein